MEPWGSRCFEEALKNSDEAINKTLFLEEKLLKNSLENVWGEP